MGTYEEWLNKKREERAVGKPSGSSNNTQSAQTAYEAWLAKKAGESATDWWGKSGIEAMNRDFSAFDTGVRRHLEQGAFSDQYEANATKWRANIQQERAWLERYGSQMGEAGSKMISDALDGYEAQLNYYDSLYSAAGEYAAVRENTFGEKKRSDYAAAGVNLSAVNVADIFSEGDTDLSDAAVVVLGTQAYGSGYDQLIKDITPYTTGTAMEQASQEDLLQRVQTARGEAKLALSWLESKKGQISEAEYSRLKQYYEDAMSGLDYMDNVVSWYKNGGSATVFSKLPEMSYQFLAGQAPVAALDQQVTKLQQELDDAYSKMDDLNYQYENIRKASAGRGVLPEVHANYRYQLADLSSEITRKEQQLAELQEEEQYYWAMAFSSINVDKNAAQKTEEGKAKYERELANFTAAWQTMAVGAQKEAGQYNIDPELASDAEKNAYMLAARKNYPAAVSIEHMTAEEKDTFYYLLGAGYDEMAVEYANAMSTERRKERMNAWQEQASGWQNVLPATLAYSMLFPVAGVDILTGGYDAETGLENPSWIGPGAVRDALVAGVTDTMNFGGKGTIGENVLLIGGKGLGDLYGVALSGAESYGAAMAMGGYAQLFLGLSAASSAYNDAVLRGADGDTALLEGVAAGAAEAVFEKISLGRFLDGKVTGNMVKDALIQAGVEGSEEIMTSLTNEILDRYLMQDKSAWQQTIQKYMAEGMSRQEATDKANKEFVESLAWDFVAGGLTGGFMGGVQGKMIYGNVDQVMAYRDSGIAGEQQLYEMAARAAGIQEGDSEQTIRSKLGQWIKDGGGIPGEVAQAVARAQQDEAEQEKNTLEEADQEKGQATEAEGTAENYYRENVGERFEIPKERLVIDQSAILEVIKENNREAISEMSNRELAESIDEQLTIRNNETADDQDREMAQAMLDVMFEEQEKRYGKNGGVTNAEVSDEGGQREDGLGAGGQAGAVAESTGGSITGSQKTAAANGSKSYGTAGAVAKRSPAEIGVIGGSEDVTVTVVPYQEVTKNKMLSGVMQEVQSEGAYVVFYRGTLKVKNKKKGGFNKAEGIRQENDDGSVTYYIKADGKIRNARQIYEHERFHNMVSGNKGLLLDLVEELDKRYSKQEVVRMVMAYVEAYDGIYGMFTEQMTADEQEELELRYLEELFADLYAEISRTRVNTAKAKKVMENQRSAIDAARENKKAMRNQNAPPGQLFSLSPTKRANLEKSLDKLGEKGIVLFAGEKRIVLQTDDFTKDKNIYSKKGRSNKEVNARIKAIPQFEKIIKESRFDWTDTQISEIDSKAKKNVIAIHHFVGEHEGFVIDIVVRDKGKTQYLYEIKFIENKKSPKQSMTDKTASTAPNGDVWDNERVPQNKAVVKQDYSIISEAEDAEYLKAVEAEDLETAQRMVDEAAERAGYTASEDWRIDHRAPTAKDDTREVYKNEIGNVKLAAVTYDDNGNVISLSERFNPAEADMRYSIEDEAAELDEEYYRATDQEEKALQAREYREFLQDSKAEKERRAEEASIQTLKNRIKASEKELNEHRGAKETLRKIGMYTQEAKERLDAKMEYIKETLAIDRTALERKQKEKKKEEKQKKYEKQQQEIKEQRARSSLKQLGTDLMGLIRPKEGVRFELRNFIEDLGEKMIRQGFLSHEDRSALFTKLYENGEELVEAPEYYADINERMRYGRVYVNEQVRKEFGDDWDAFRKRAWGLKIYLTNDINDLGIDQWTMELADAFGGRFSDEELDLRTQLETIVEAAEEGKAQHITLAEMMARNRNEYGWSIEEQMDDLERKVDDILFTFAQKADLEIQLRQRSMAQLIKERERFRKIVEDNQSRKMENAARTNVMKRIQQLSKMRKKASPEYRKMIDETLQGIDTVARKISPRGLEDLQELAQKYYEASEAMGDNFLKNEYVEKRLLRLGQMQLDDMDLSKVRELGNVVSGIIHSIEYSNKLLTEARNDSIENAAKKIQMEVEQAKGSKGGFLRKIKENQLDAKRFFAELGGWSNGELEGFAKRLSNGQSKVMNYQMQASHIFDKFLESKENRKWLKKASGSKEEWIKVEIPVDYTKEDSMTQVKFRTIEITPMMRVALLMHSRNEDNLRHIAGGGVLIPNKTLYKKGNMADAYARGLKFTLSPSIVKAIVKNCTEQEVAFSKLLAQYFDGLSKDAINETSMMIDGFERAGVWNYYPIISDKSYLAKQNDAIKRDMSIGALGSIVNERVHAQNPLVLEDATRTLMTHIDSISKYYGYAAVLRDLNAVLSHVFHKEGESFSGSVMATIKAKWGAGAEKYIDKIMADMQMPESNSDLLSDFFAKLRGNYAKAVISANPSSVLKQLASYAVADAYLGERALLHGLNFPNKADAKTLEKYSALYWYRSQGNNTTEIGDVMKKKEFGDKVPWLFNATQLMDSLVTKRLLAACEFKIQKDTKLQPGTQEEIQNGTDRYWMEVAKLFNEVVLNTQSNSTLMERPQITRASDKSISRFFTMFKTDAFQQFNMLVEAKGRVQYAIGQYKTNPTEANKKALKKAKKFARRTYGGIIVGQAWVSLVVGLIALLKGKDEDYRDEEDNWDWGKVAIKFGKDMVEGFAGFVIGLDTIYSAVEVAIDNAMGGDSKWYDIEANGVNLLMDGFEQIAELGGVLKNLTLTEGMGWIRDTAKVLAKAFGIPAENFETYLLSVVRIISPEWSEKYENFWDETTKADLSRESKRTMEAAIGVIMDNRTEGLGEEDQAEIARLYWAGGTGAVPSGIPSSVEYTQEDGEKITVDLSTSDREEYREIWSGIVSSALPELLASEDYAKATDEGKAALIDKLYKYANDMAKHSLVPDKELDRWVQQGENAAQEGIPLAEYICFRVNLSDVDGKDEKGEPVDGLKAYRTMELLESMGWSNAQEQSVYFDVLAQKSDGDLTKDGQEMEALLSAGLSWDNANDVVTMIGKKKDRITAIAKLNVSDKIKAAALMVYGSDKEKKMFDAGLHFGVDFADYAEVINNADADNSGSVSQEEAEKYIRSMGIGWTDAAYLWQMITDDKDGADNPFGDYWGRAFYDYAHRNDPEED